jgi:MFS family permease
MAMTQVHQRAPRLTQALLLPSFALLWAGQTASRLGDRIFQVALGWYVLQLTGSAAAMGTLLLCTTLPLLVLLLLGGVISDRLPRRSVLLASDVGRGALVLTLAFLAWGGAVQLWQLYVVAVLFGTVDAFFQPAYGALVPEIVPEELRASANGLTLLSAQASAVIGPLLGALLMHWGGAALAFNINGVSFLCSAALLALMRAPGARPADERTSVRLELAEGLRYVAGVPWLRVTIAIFALVVVATGAPLAALPLLVRQRLGDSVDQLGWIYAASAAGAVAAALAVARVRRLRRRGAVAYAATLVSGAGLVTLGLAPSLPLALLGAFADGVGIAVFSLVWTQTLQNLVPERLLGRVNSVDMLGSYCLLPLGFGLAGVLADRIGAGSLFALGGGATVLLAAFGLLLPAVRNLD